MADERAGAGRDRLAGAGRRAVLPGHRPRPDGPRPPPPLRRRGPQAARHRGRAVRRRPPRRRADSEGDDGDGPGPRLLARCSPPSSAGRTGQLGDIVATIQAEQDEIIRSPQAGVLVVQGGPGTGKTVVALHRAAYLLYTYRFPLEDQGVLVIGPNRVFLRYIERVLPVARRGRRRAGRAGRPRARRALRRRRRRRADGPGQGRRPHGRGHRQGGRATASGRCGATSSCPSASRHLRLRAAESDAHRPGGPPPLPPPQRRPPLRRGRGLRRAGRQRPATGVDAEPCASALRHADEVRAALERHVAGAHAGAAAPRPVRLDGPAAPGRRRAGSTDDEIDAAAPAPLGRASTTCAGRRARRRPARRGPRRCSAPAGAGPHGEASTTTTRSAPTATSWSTRCRTSRRCSCAWPPAAR